jgi:hypothetical protein
MLGAFLAVVDDVSEQPGCMQIVSLPLPLTSTCCFRKCHLGHYSMSPEETATDKTKCGMRVHVCDCPTVIPSVSVFSLCPLHVCVG